MSDATKKPKREPKKPNFGARHIDVTDSAMVEKVYYDVEGKTLDVVYKKGTRYRYKRIPHKTFAEFVLAKSMGRYFNAYIRDTYRFEKVE